VSDPGAGRSSPRRVEFGADAWLVLVAAVPGVRLPAPFRAEDGPALSPEQQEAAERALRASGVVPGTGGDLLADLHPSLRTSLLVHAAPQLVITSAVGLGGDHRIARHAMAGPLASAVSRRQRPVEGGLQLGPVTLSTMSRDDLATDVVRGLEGLSGRPDRQVLTIDAAEALAVVRALGEGKLGVALAIVDGADVPAPLDRLAGGLRSVARIDLTTAQGTRVLLALATEDGWWTAMMAFGDLELRPVDEDALVVELASALAGTLVRQAAGA